MDTRVLALGLVAAATVMLMLSLNSQDSFPLETLLEFLRAVGSPSLH